MNTLYFNLTNLPFSCLLNSKRSSSSLPIINDYSSNDVDELYDKMLDGEASRADIEDIENMNVLWNTVTMLIKSISIKTNDMAEECSQYPSHILRLLGSYFSTLEVLIANQPNNLKYFSDLLYNTLDHELSTDSIVQLLREYKDLFPFAYMFIRRTGKNPPSCIDRLIDQYNKSTDVELEDSGNLDDYMFAPDIVTPSIMPRQPFTFDQHKSPVKSSGEDEIQPYSFYDSDSMHSPQNQGSVAEDNTLYSFARDDWIQDEDEDSDGDRYVPPVKQPKKKITRMRANVTKKVTKKSNKIDLFISNSNDSSVVPTSGSRVDVQSVHDDFDVEEMVLDEDLLPKQASEVKPLKVFDDDSEEEDTLKIIGDYKRTLQIPSKAAPQQVVRKDSNIALESDIELSDTEQVESNNWQNNSAPKQGGSPKGNQYSDNLFKAKRTNPLDASIELRSSATTNKASSGWVSAGVSQNSRSPANPLEKSIDTNEVVSRAKNPLDFSLDGPLEDHDDKSGKKNLSESTKSVAVRMPALPSPAKDRGDKDNLEDSNSETSATVPIEEVLTKSPSPKSYKAEEIKNNKSITNERKAELRKEYLKRKELQEAANRSASNEGSKNSSPGKPIPSLKNSLEANAPIFRKSVSFDQHDYRKLSRSPDVQGKERSPSPPSRTAGVPLSLNLEDQSPSRSIDSASSHSTINIIKPKRYQPAVPFKMPKDYQKVPPQLIPPPLSEFALETGTVFEGWLNKKSGRLGLLQKVILFKFVYIILLANNYFL